MKRILYIYRWTVAVLVFSQIAALVFIGMIFYRPQQLFVLIQPLCRLLLRVISVRVKVTGLDNFDHRRPYLIICNHESLLDAFICPGYIPLFFTVLELTDHFSWPVWGKMTKKWGNIPVRKGNLKAAMESLDRARILLKNGTSILIFPEGERTISGKMNSFRKGAFHLAKSARADILPIGMKGLWQAKTKGDWRVRSANVNFNFGRPLYYNDYQHLSLDQLKDWADVEIRRLKHSA
ncbi:1-acyl-sn-glycerol-3-phosphate acyltransferase [bacterium]|nr:1-acyl-sn-glycerol-3-phosphate acyltransferase [bacterium]MBU1063425.1 1-acyl-sn-glycerol-3-phosphate acyltransferase [bacterium]MBU1634511.1 1-acyl-sn-glycerol-3-phosphate acyltransferase [bacterium]MBU1874887.1 1-acyl-sn-glycerol-3-phosphate acyltransferase [bacterium]